jgi:hypothetical protein
LDIFIFSDIHFSLSFDFSSSSIFILYHQTHYWNNTTAQHNT